MVVTFNLNYLFAISYNFPYIIYIKALEEIKNLIWRRSVPRDNI